jgi:hypothetical protein
MKSLIIAGTFIAGEHKPQGLALDLDESTLRVLKENEKAVEYSAATKDQLELEKALNAASKKGDK